MSETTVKDGFMFGSWREGINAARNMKGSIHDDATAQKIGMRGGTVAGTVHLDLFAPPLQQIFGKTWFEHGTLSMFYTFATIDREPVRAVVQVPPKGARDIQVEGRVELQKELRVSERGTVSIGNPKEKPYLQTIEFKNAPKEELRILAGINVGDEFGPRDVMAKSDNIETRLANCEDTIDWYTKSPWGQPIVPLSHLFGLLHIYDNQQFKAVPFFGATEFQMVNGPVKANTAYTARTKIICVGAGEKTELFWIDGWLYEKGTTKLVATMRHLNRYMKAGSPLYPEIK